MKINGTPQPDRHRKLGGRGIKPPKPPKDDSCGEAIVLFAIVAGGWLHMIATSAGWVS